MYSRFFNSIMHTLNGDWAAKSLDMKLNEKGPDLTDEETNTIVELKFSLVKSQYTALEYQLAYGNGKNAYWGFGFYLLDRPVKKIRKNAALKSMEKMVLSRELWVVPWDFIDGYEPHPTKGKTKLSEWDHTLRYPRFRDIPEVSTTLEVKGGLVHFTKDVQLEHFNQQ